MGWFKNMIKNWLELQPAQDITTMIQEAETFETNVIKNTLWYRGSASELHQFYTQTDDGMGNTKFWCANSSNGVQFRKIHSGLASLIIDTLTDIAVDDINEIKIANETKDLKETKLWENISKDNNFLELVKDATKEALYKGDGAFKISLDKSLSLYPILEFYGSDRVKFNYIRGRLKSIIFLTRYTKKEKVYQLEEEYSKEYIKYKLYDNNNKEVLLSTCNETKNLVDIKNKGNFMMAIPIMFGKSPKFKGRGKSLFDTKTDAFDAFDEAFSQWMDALRDGRANKYIPEKLIPRNPKNGSLAFSPNPFDNRFVKIEADNSENASNKIEVVQGSINHDALTAAYVTALDNALQGLISPSTLGIDVKKLDNAESQREKEKITLYSRTKIIRVLESVIPKVVDALLKTYYNDKEEPLKESGAEVTFGEYANPSFEAVVETIGKGKTYGVISIDQCVEEMYGDSKDEDWKVKEINRLKQEQGIIVVNEPSVNIDTKDAGGE